ncbi:hypothetical protein [Maridesulfovibrio zosterae]|uniref:hypothetical protein n=1 Tax=Maridesulfovibrio zosterae TaxID=82171 RepID=UPI00041721F8|nr:hypothetical protein [Maridesulfovibrio zosterae]
MNTAAKEITSPIWMDTNLNWNPQFWKSIKAKTLMRLNPHWHIDKNTDSGTPVEDLLVNKKFISHPELAFTGNTFNAFFPETGLRISARMKDGGNNTALSYDFSQIKDVEFTQTDAEETIKYWLPSLREYYRLHESNSFKHKFWRFFMDKIMLTMNPAQRRICSFMFKLTVLEVILITALLIGWNFYGA